MNILSYPFLLLAFFLLANLILGLIKGRGVKTVSDFALGRGPFNSFALTMTLLATKIGGNEFYGTTKRLASIGLFALTGFTLYSLSCVIRSYLITNQIDRFSNCISFGDFIGTLYGNIAKSLCGFLAGLMCISHVSLQISILGIIFNEFFGLNFLYSIIFSTVVISVYTSLGGMRSVVATDILQFVITVFTLFIIICFCLSNIKDNFDSLYKLPTWLFSPKTLTFKYFISRIPLVFFLVSIFDGPEFLRILMAKNKESAKKMFLYTAVGNIVIGLMLFFIILLAMLVLGEKINADNPINFIIKRLVPYKLIPFVGLGFIAVIFSTCDSYLHAAGIFLSKDFLEPFLKRDIKLFEVRFVTFFVGIFSMVIVLWFNGLLNFAHFFYFADPVLAVPVLYGFLGFKGSSKMFWFSAFMGILGTLISSSIPSFQAIKGTIGCFSSLIAYFAVHYYENKGFKFIGNPILSRTEMLILKLKLPNMEKIKFRLKRSFEYYHGLYTRFGVVFLLLTICFYVFVATTHSPYFMEMFAFGAVAVVLLCLLIPIVMYPIQIRFLMPIYFYLVATYTLPFLVTLNLALCGFTFIFINMILVVIFSFLSLFEKWKHSLLMVCIGASAAIIVSKYIISINPHSDFIIRGPSLSKTVLFQTMSCGIGGAFFVSTNESRGKRMGKVIDYLNNFYKEADLKLKNDVFNDAAKKRKRDIDEEKKSRNEIVEKILHNSANQDIPKCLESCLELKSQLKKVKEDYIVYYIYPDLYDIKSLASELKSVVNVAGCPSVSVEIDKNIDSQVRCDKLVIEKALWKFANDFCVYNINAEENDAVITFSSTTINYHGYIPDMYRFGNLGINSVFALCITLSDREFLRSPISPVRHSYLRRIDKITKIDFTDPEMRDVVFGVFAHYGVVEVALEKLVWQCVIPFDHFVIKDRINLAKEKANAAVKI